MKLSVVLGAACLIAIVSAQPALCGKLEAPAFPPIEGGVTTNDVAYSSSPPTISAYQKYGPIDRFDIFSIHDGTETFDYAIVGDGKMQSLNILLPDPGRYRVRADGIDAVFVYDTGTPTSVIAPLIRRDCEDGGALLVSGTAASALSGVRVMNVAVARTDGKLLWWSGVEWTRTGTWLLASGRDSWEIRLPHDFKKGGDAIHVFASALSNAMSRESPHDAMLQIPPECP